MLGKPTGTSRSFWPFSSFSGAAPPDPPAPDPALEPLEADDMSAFAFALATSKSELGLSLLPELSAEAPAPAPLPGPSGGDLSIVMAARFFPLIAFMLFGGVLADRFRRNRLVGGSDVIGSFLAMTSAISLIAGFSSVWLLALMGGLFGILNAIWWPAMSGVLPEIVPKEELQKGNAVVGLVTNIGYIVGTLIGGVIVATFGAGWGLLADALSFFIAGVIVWNLPILGKIKEKSPGIAHDLRVGWKEFISRSWVIALVISFSLINMNFESLLSVLGPLNFNDSQTGPKHWSYNLAGLSLGMLVGGLWILKVKLKRPLFFSMILIALSGIWDLALALDFPIYTAVISAFFAGISTETLS